MYARIIKAVTRSTMICSFWNMDLSASLHP